MRKLLLVLLIAFVGAGIAFGASTVFFSSSPEEEAEVVEPQGLVDDAPTAKPAKPSPSPSPSPKVTARPATSGGSGGSGSSGSGTAAAAAAEEETTPRSGDSAGQVINSQNGVVVTEGDGFSEECRDEDSEEEREACEDELEQEAEEEEEKAEENG